MTEKTITNPPAFPRYSPEIEAAGMSLLDHFAGQALVGMLANPDSAGLRPDLVAADCYTYAQAMLAERAEREAGR